MCMMKAWCSPASDRYTDVRWCQMALVLCLLLNSWCCDRGDENKKHQTCMTHKGCTACILCLLVLLVMMMNKLLCTYEKGFPAAEIIWNMKTSVRTVTEKYWLLKMKLQFNCEMRHVYIFHTLLPIFRGTSKKKKKETILLFHRI